MSNDGKTSLHWAAAYNAGIPRIERLLFEQADVNARDSENKTLLHEAAIKNEDESHYEVMKTLLRSGADVNARDSSGWTPLFYLVQRGNVKIVNLLLKYDADIYLVGYDGQTLLFPAVTFSKNVDLVQLLIDLGLSVNHRDADGKTPLHWACEYLSACDKIKVIKCLMKNGADVNALDRGGVAPLIQAVHRASRSLNMHEARLKKNLSFIMDRTDFKAILIDDFNFKSVSHPDYWFYMFLKHLAMLQSLDVPVNPAFSIDISKNAECSKYFNRCKKELLRAKTTKPKNCWISYYSVLVGDKKKLKNYAGNRDLIDDLRNSDWLQKFPVYGVSMFRNLRKGLAKRKLFDKSAVLLSDSCLPLLNPTHLIIRDVLECILSNNDLKKFCEENENCSE